jgi:hypothetical protein
MSLQIVGGLIPALIKLERLANRLRSSIASAECQICASISQALSYPIHLALEILPNKDQQTQKSLFEKRVSPVPQSCLFDAAQFLSTHNRLRWPEMHRIPCYLWDGVGMGMSRSKEIKP